MRILLIGEYSRLHNSLKEGLQALGHQVTLLGDGDAFKNYPVDLPVTPRFLNSPNPLLSAFRKTGVKLFKTDPVQWEYAYRFFRLKEKLKDFDIVQLINENALKTTPYLEKKAVRFLRKHNKKLFLLSCGEDHHSVSYMLKHPEAVTVLTPFYQDKTLKKHFHYTLKYASRPYRSLSRFLYKNIDGIIASGLDYHLPLVQLEKYKGLIPNPVNIDAIPFQPVPVTDTIRIFHGINTWSCHKKGNRYFEAALRIILEKYPGRVAVKTVQSVPYKTYIKSHNNAHIVLDQVYGYDQGYNALEAMAKGKVVFTGADEIFMEHYKLKEPVAVNALPDVDALVKQLSFFIENPQEITAMGKRARAFIEAHHHYIKIAGKYLDTWNASLPAN